MFGISKANHNPVINKNLEDFQVGLKNKNANNQVK